MTNMLKELAELQASQRRVAAERYRALLLRASSPQKGDVAALAEVLAVLGRNASVEQDAELFARMEDLRRIVAHAEESETAAAARATEAGRLFEETKVEADRLSALLQERSEAAESAGVAFGTLASANAKARADLRALEDEWAAIARGVPLQTIREERRQALLAAAPTTIHGPAAASAG